ncbi:DUF5659 domain-containing protein [Aeribacillus composti]|uniref:DUF5659 domain-containing protein n=1 Tax=Aeribacillus composti TaxID=1868734 RepID=UPI002E1F1667|nr:DUF5659 domain-containing protein [Aeribacillus composti]
MNSKQFFFCYSKDLSQYIKSKGIDSITTALSPSTKKKFTLFYKSEELQKTIDEYNKNKSFIGG